MTQLFEVEGHPTIPTSIAPTIPAKLVDDFTPTLVDFGEHHLCPGCGEPIAMRSAMEVVEELDLVTKTIVVFGIGCYTAYSNNLDVEVLQALHGRAPSLATGVKRFKLPDEFNFINILRGLARDEQGGLAESALDELAQVFEDRRQYPKAADAWRKGIERYGPGPDGNRRQQLDQIVGNWARFESVMTQPAGRGATSPDPSPGAGACRPCHRPRGSI